MLFQFHGMMELKCVQTGAHEFLIEGAHGTALQLSILLFFYDDNGMARDSSDDYWDSILQL